MSWWAWLADPKPPPADSPGDANGAELVGEETFVRSMPFPVPSAWDGWPAEWGTRWDSTSTGLNKLIDIAWACIDLNSRVLSTMPVYRLKSGEMVEPKTWMINPDPMIYSSWAEFAKQMFWDYQCAGEVFILGMSWESGFPRYPATLRVIPPWLVNVELSGGRRVYNIGKLDVTDDILHIRYQSNTADAHGHGPLEIAGARMVTAGLLQRYANTLAETGGTPHYWLGIEKWLNPTEANDLLTQWVDSRKRHAGEPGLLSGGAELHQTQSMSAKDMSLLELAQFSESRIAVLLGVPPFLAGLPGPGGLTYANESQLFDFHDRSALRPEAHMVMSGLSYWALPSTQCVELNRDEYTRPDFVARAGAWGVLIDHQVVSPQEVRVQERFNGDAPGSITGNYDATVDQVSQPTVNQSIPAAGGRNGNAVQGN